MGRNRNSEGTVNQNINFWIPNMKELMGSSHQKVNLAFPNFLYEFFSIWTIEKSGTQKKLKKKS